MRIATFNLEDFHREARDAAQLEARISIMRPQLERLDADVLCLQELNSERRAAGQARAFHSLRALLEGTRYKDYSWVSTTAGTTGKFADKHNLMVLSRFAIRDNEQLCNRLMPAPRHRPITARPPARGDMDVTWDRPILCVRIELPGGRILHLINVHLRAPLAVPIEGRKTGPFTWNGVDAWAEGFYLAALKRCGQALETRLVVERIFDEDADALVLVCGDFNATASQDPVRIIRGDPEDTGNGELSYRAMVPLENTVPHSQRHSVLHGGRRHMLDHMLASNALLGLFRGVEIHNEALQDELVAYAVGGPNPASFHAPVVASFEFGDKNGAA